MARSRRRTPIVGITTATSEKHDKRLANRALRAALRAALAADRDAPMPVMRDVSDPWCFDKDGRKWIGDRWPEFLRK